MISKNEKYNINIVFMIIRKTIHDYQEDTILYFKQMLV